MGGNSIACRKGAATSANEVKADKAAHHARCMDAGPFSPRCGGMIANFCKVELALCPGMPFPSEAACNSALPMVMKDGFDVSNVNDPMTPSRNSKLCRFYHIEKATEDPVTHCPHANSPTSPVCTQ